MQVQRDLAQRAYVAGHILAGAAIAAGGRQHEHARFIAQADCEAVKLEFGRVSDGRRRVVQPQGTAHAGIEGDRALIGGVGFGADRQHRHRMMHGRQLGGRLAADTLGRRCGGDQFGMLGLQRLEFAKQTIVLGVRHRRRVEHIVGVIMTLQLRAQRICLRTDFRACHHSEASLRRTGAAPAKSPGRCPAPPSAPGTGRSGRGSGRPPCRRKARGYRQPRHR